MWPDINVRYHPWSLDTLFFETEAFSEPVASPVHLDWLASEFQGSACLHLPQLWSYRHVLLWAFIWMLDIQYSQ